jgi:hypothetical protein
MFKILFLFSVFFVFAACQPAFADFNVQTDALYTATVTSTKVISRNNSRHYLLIQNLSSTIGVTVTLGAAQSAGEGVYIVAGGNWEPIVAPHDSIYLKSASSTASVEIVEGQ